MYSDSTHFVIDLSYYESFNDEHDVDYNKMAEVLGLSSKEAKVADLYKLWWEKFPKTDMPFKGPENPRHVCTDNAEDAQKIWGKLEDLNNDD